MPRSDIPDIHYNEAEKVSALAVMITEIDRIMLIITYLYYSLIWLWKYSVMHDSIQITHIYDNINLPHNLLHSK